MTPLRKHFPVVFFLAFVATQAQAQITGIKIVGDTCASLTLDLQALGTSSSPYFAWDFGDPASGTNNTVTITGASPSPFPTHTFSSAGSYTVCVSLQEPGDPVSTVCRTIAIGLCCSGSIASNDSCLQNSIPFSIVSDSVILGVSWNFGDPTNGSSNTSNGLSPGHVFSAVGPYTVTANVAASCGTFQATYDLNIIDCNVPCTGTITISDNCLLNGTVFQVSSASTITGITWDFGDPSTGSSNTSIFVAPVHVFSGLGTYNVTANVTALCGSFQVSYTIVIIDCTTNCTGIIASADSCLQAGTSFQVTSSAILTGINWNFGDPASGVNNTSSAVTPAHVFSAAGSYTITADVTAVCGSFQLSYVLQVVDCTTNCTASIVSADSCLQSGTSFQIVADSPLSAVIWDFGDPGSGSANSSIAIAPTHRFSTSGTFSVRAIINTVCGIDTLYRSVSVTDCDSIAEACPFYVPNAFTPNGDGKNDQFNPESDCAFTTYDFQIFNRWGNLLYRTTSPSEKWDGRYNGANCSEGMYVYLITYGFGPSDLKSAIGAVTLIR